MADCYTVLVCIEDSASDSSATIPIRSERFTVEVIFEQQAVSTTAESRRDDLLLRSVIGKLAVILVTKYNRSFASFMHAIEYSDGYPFARY